ncbi:MAG TPA: hypothetical protein VK166_10550, partial [Chitinophagaceae bacterium]|nr:hypothetical protein [Chitinophagaceae bacterium]
MHKKLSVILFMFVMLAQTFSGFVLKVDYFFNISSYIEKCINKKKPELKCNGQCHLAKKMNAAERNDEGNSSGKSEVFSTVLSSRSYPPHLGFGVDPIEISWNDLNICHIEKGFYPDV